MFVTICDWWLWRGYICYSLWKEGENRNFTLIYFSAPFSLCFRKALQYLLRLINLCFRSITFVKQYKLLRKNFFNLLLNLLWLQRTRMDTSERGCVLFAYTHSHSHILKRRCGQWFEKIRCFTLVEIHKYKYISAKYSMVGHIRRFFSSRYTIHRSHNK